MKTNILINTLIGFGKVISRTFLRSDSLSIVSRQSDLRTYSAESSCETFSVGQCSPHAFPFEAKSQLASSHQSVLAILVACLTVFGVGNAWGDVTLYQETFGDNGSSNTVIADATTYSASTTYFTAGHQTSAVSNYSGDSKVGKNNVAASDNDGASGNSAVWFTGPASPAQTKTLFQVDNINISGYTSLSLKFNLYRTNGTNSNNYVTVKYTIDSGSEQTLSFTAPSNAAEWTWCTGSLSGTGSSLTIKFLHYTNGGYTMRLDDIILTGISAGYAVTYNNGGHGTAPSNTTASSVTLSDISATATGWTCTGWKANVAVTNTSTSASIAANTLIANGTGVTLSQATTFTAQWSANQYTVTLNDNTGSGGSGSKTVTYDSNTNLTTSVAVPTKSHHDFAGYWTSTDAGSTFGTKLVNADGSWVASVTNYTDASKNWIKADNVTLYAKWTEHSLTNYRTVCCTELGAVGGAVNFTDPTTAVLTWNKMSNVAASTPYTVTYRTGSDAYGSSNVGAIDLTGAKATCTITGLSCNTDYDFKISVTAASGYCDKEEILEDQNSGKYSITKTGSGTVTGGTFTTKISSDAVTEACNGATISIDATPSTGYAFSSWTIDKAGGGTVTPAAASASTSFTMPSDDVTVTAAFSCVEPVIGTDPESASYQQGASPSALTVAATLASGTLTYQWQKSTDGGDNWSNESGTGYNTATYAAANISTASVGTTKYRCIVGNSEGGCTVTSGVATITITAAANFVNGTTVFIQAESSSAWDASACVKAWFNNNGSDGAAQATYWLFDATGNKKIYAAVVPASGNVNQVTLQRFASNCSDFWNNNGTLTKASDGGSNIFCSNGSGNSNVEWNGSSLTMNLMSSDAWLTPVATLTDQGAGVWTGTYEYTPSNTSTEYIVATNYNGNIGNTGNNSNATLSGMIVGSTYNVTATLNVISHSLSMSKTFVKGTVHFDLQGHGLAIADLTNVTNGSTIDAPSEPSEFGYTFGGWFKEPGCTNAWDFENDGVSETMTLYAKWTANVYTITKTFSNVANAGLPASFTYTGNTTTALNSTFTVNTTNFFLPSSITVTMGGTPLTVGTDYTYNNSTGAFTFLRIINADIVITASATAKLTGIEITTDPTKLIYLAGESFNSTGAEVTATMGNGDTKDVTASVTWTPAGALSAGTSQTVTATYTEAGVEKTATTTIDVYSVTINKVNMSDDAIEDANVTVGRDGYNLSQSVGGTNYLFNSWNVTAGGVTISDNTITGTPNANIVINAKFHDPITVTWKVGNGAASGSPTTEVKYGEAISALPSTPADNAIQTNCGANKFMGWTAGGKIEGTGHSAPADLFNSTSDAGCVALTANTTYRAVFATRGPGYKDTTIVEDFEKQSTGTIYNTTVEYSKDNSNAKIGWVMYYGTNSTSGPIKGSKSAQMRWYNSALENYPYIKSTTQLRSLSNIKFSARVGNTDVKMDVAYSDDNGDSWTPIATKVAFADTYKKAFSYNIPGVDATNYLIKIGVNSESDPPASNYSLLVDSVAFTYKTPTTITADYITGCCTPLAAIGGAVEFSNPTTAVLTWNDMSNVADSNPYVVTYRTGSDPYGSSNVGTITTNGAGKKTCTITGLSCNTSYDFKIAVTAAEDYCNIDSVMTATSTKYSITKDVVTGGSCTTKISTDDVTEACNGATILIAATPSAGYTFSSWTITKAGGGTVEPAASSASTSFTMPSDNVTVTPTFSCIVPNHIDITGRWDRFGGETISLTATAYATEGTGSPIPAADITGYKWQKWYNEQWNDVSDGGNISGTSTNNLVITNSIGGNSGSYRCVVTTGATCPAYSSDGREVKVFALECYTGGTTSYNFTRDGENERGSVEVTLAANTAYTFKIHADNVYYGNSGTVNEDVADWLCTIGAGNLTVNSGLGGTFTFTMDYSSAGSSSTVGDPEISVTYPRKTIYLTPGDWNADGAKFAFYYFRKENETIYGEGFTDFITAGDCGSSAEIPQWNGVKINAVRLNSNTTVEELTNPANHYAAAWAKKWNQTSDITISNYNSITITGMGGGGDSPYTYGTYSVPTYTISYATGSTTYTGENAISGSKASETKTCGEDFTLPNAAVFTTTGYTQTGWATSDGGSQAYAFGGSYATNASQAFYPAWTANTHSLSWSANGGDALTGDYTTGTVAYGTTIVAPDTPTKTGYTFAGWHNGTAVVTPESTMPDNDLSYTAQWNLATYQVTLTTNGGTINAGNVTSYTYGTGATLPTNVTRDGYRFDGWFDNVGLTGDVVTTISSSATGDKAFWAKWTKIHTVTWHVGNGTWSVGQHNVDADNTQVLDGSQIATADMPDDPADNTLSSCASKFMGWSKKNYGSTSGKDDSDYDDLFKNADGSPTISGNTDFYAVFASGAGAAVNTVMWSEDWTGATYSDGSTGMDAAKPSAQGAHTGKTVYGSATVTYSETDAEVYVRNDNTAKGAGAPELLIKSSKAWTISDIPTGGAVTLTLSFTTNKSSLGTLTVATTEEGKTPTMTGSITGSSAPYYGSYTITTDGASTINITFGNTSNTRLDDIDVKVATVSLTNYVTECDANIVSVTYNANGGTTSCTNTTTDKTEDFTVCATEPTRDYYTFAGWLCSADDEVYDASATIDNAIIDADFSLTAQWTPVPYSITYELYGGTNSGSNPATYNVETATITLQDPTKGHDRFEGWFSTYSAGVYSDQVTSIPLGSHGDITLHAKWAERHEIIFDVDGTTTTIYRADDEDLSASIAEQGSVPDDPDAPTACSSKVFVGWSESEIDDETDDEPADLMKPAVGTVDEDKHYYAVWANESSETGTVYLYNGSFEQVTSGTAYGNKGKWETSTVFGTGTAGEVRMSSNSSSGSMDLDLSDKTLATTITVTFKMKRYGTEAGTVTLSCMDDGSTASFGSSPFSYPSGDDNWHDYSSTVTSVNNAKTNSIHFTSTSGKRVYVKDIVVSQIGTVYNYTAYSTSCCATKVTLSQNSPSNGTIAFGKTSVGTCGGDKDVSLTITPAAGYQLHSYEVATGSGKVAAKSVSPDIALDNNSSAAQNITLTFAEDANGAYDVTASFTLMTVTSWAWTLNSAAIPDPLNLYVGQSARLDVAYTPAGVDASKKTYTRDKDNTYINWVGGLNANYSTISGRASTGENTTAVTFTHADGPETVVNVKVLPLPLVHFTDLVHGKAFADVVATIEANALSATKTTPTSDDWTTPNANTCEENHLHLVGWIREDWPALVNYLNGTGDAPSTAAIIGAGNDGSGNAYFFAPGASINTQTFNGVTFYAVWARVD